MAKDLDVLNSCPQALLEAYGEILIEEYEGIFVLLISWHPLPTHRRALTILLTFPGTPSNVNVNHSGKVSATGVDEVVIYHHWQAIGSPRSHFSLQQCHHLLVKKCGFGRSNPNRESAHFWRR
jgi:hypothetical protein